MERDIKKCRATSRVPVSGSIAHKVDRGQWSQYSFLSPLIISGPICEVEHRGGAQSPWAVAGCGGGDSRFFIFFLLLLTYLAPRSHRHKHVDAQKNPRRETRCVRFSP